MLLSALAIVTALIRLQLAVTQMKPAPTVKNWPAAAQPEP